MAGRPSRWRWALFASIGLVAAAAVLVGTTDSPELRKVGFGIFIAAAVTYVSARIAMIVEDRYR